MDYVAFFANELAYVGAVERLIDIEVPPRAQWIRTLFAELNRIHSHLIYLGTSASSWARSRSSSTACASATACSTSSRW